MTVSSPSTGRGPCQAIVFSATFGTGLPCMLPEDDERHQRDGAPPWPDGRHPFFPSEGVSTSTPAAEVCPSCLRAGPPWCEVCLNRNLLPAGALDWPAACGREHDDTTPGDDPIVWIEQVSAQLRSSGATAWPELLDHSVAALRAAAGPGSPLYCEPPEGSTAATRGTQSVWRPESPGGDAMSGPDGIPFGTVDYTAEEIAFIESIPMIKRRPSPKTCDLDAEHGEATFCHPTPFGDVWLCAWCEEGLPETLRPESGGGS